MRRGDEEEDWSLDSECWLCFVVFTVEVCVCVCVCVCVRAGALFSVHRDSFDGLCADILNQLAPEPFVHPA